MSDIAFLSFGLVGGRPVFMDERHDSYFLLERDLEAEFLVLIDRNGRLEGGGSPGLRSALGGPYEAVRTVRAKPPHAVRSLLDEIGAAAGPRIGDVLGIALHLRHARSAIATRPIGEILADLARDAATVPPEPDEDAVVRAAARFIAARRLVPHARSCLTESLALLQWLGRPPGAALVFGVKLEPFGAHCWAQFGELLLNDRPDAIAQFRPVRVIECVPATR